MMTDQFGITFFEHYEDEATFDKLFAENEHADSGMAKINLEKFAVTLNEKMTDARVDRLMNNYGMAVV